MEPSAIRGWTQMSRRGDIMKFRYYKYLSSVSLKCSSVSNNASGGQERNLYQLIKIIIKLFRKRQSCLAVSRSGWKPPGTR